MSMEFPNLLAFPVHAYDTETTGLNPAEGARVFGFSISTPDGKDYYYDIREAPEAVDRYNQQMAHYEGKTVCHNLSFDYRLSNATGLDTPLKGADDTSIRASLINEHEVSYSLDSLARKYTRSHKKGTQLYKDLAALFGGPATKNVQMKNISRAPSQVVSPYAMGDTRSTLELWEWQEGQIESQGLQKIQNFEREVTPLLIKAEMHGVRVDINRAADSLRPLSVRINAIRKQIDDMAGFRCNPQPSKDIAKLFNPKWKDGRWWAVDGTPLQETAAGNASLDAEALRLMSHPAAELVLQVRSLIKTRDTFLAGHVIESSVEGRVYPGINQCKGESGGTGTGRLSIVAPALQQIPDRNKIVAQAVKSAFLPDEGHSWVDMDLKSFEVRIFGHLVGTSDIVKVYKDDPETDFHQFVANLTGLPRNPEYGGQANAKQLNLSMIFNQGNGTTADEMGMGWTWESFIPRDTTDGKPVVYKKPSSEAMAVINEYHSRLPGVNLLADGCSKVAKERGYLFTRYGRHLRFPYPSQAYKASGILIQATSADENKRNWVVINEAIKGTEARLLLNTHDSYSFSMPIGEEEKISKMVKQAVEEDRGLRVPLILEVQRPGANWWESKSSKRWM